MASLSFTSISYNSFRVRVTGMSTSSGVKGILWYVNGEEYADWTDYDIAEDDTSSDRLTVDGLDSGTEYEVTAVIYYSDGWDDYVTDTVVTDLYEPDLSSAEVVLKGTSTDSLTVRVEGLDTDYSGTWIFEFYIYDADGNEIDTISNSRGSGYSSSSSVTFDDLESSTEYYIDVKIFYDYGDEQESTWIDGIYCTTDGGEYYEPDYSDAELVATVNGTDVTLEIIDLDPDYDDVWQVKWQVWKTDSDDDYIVNYTLRSDINTDLYWTYDRITLNESHGLETDTQYTAYVQILPYPDAEKLPFSIHILYTYFTTGNGNRPSKFSWTYTKTKGGTFNLKAFEWCDLLDNINAVRVYKGLNKVTTGTKASLQLSNYYNYFTYPESGDVFLYQHYNQALNGITGITGSGYTVNAVKQGQVITADCLNLLVEMINDIE